MQSPTQLRGQQKERLAEHYLTRRGLRLLMRNYRCKAGEIDLVMRHGGHLVFVEVRYRKSSAFGSPLETVTRGKQRKLVRTAQHYLLTNPADSALPCRFDVIAITDDADPQWVTDAFGA